MRKATVVSAFLLVAAMMSSGAALAEPATALYLGRTVDIERTLADPTDLWVSPQDLTRINDFELKPEGACLDDICVPVRQDRDSEIFVSRQDEPWINVSELADRLARGSLDHDPEEEVIRVAVAGVGSRREIEAALTRKEGNRFIARERLVQTSASVVSEARMNQSCLSRSSSFRWRTRRCACSMADVSKKSGRRSLVLV